MKPKLAACNIIKEIAELKSFVNEHGFSGIDWSFDINELPGTPSEESMWVQNMAALNTFEVRYHCPFDQVDLGHDEPEETKAAVTLFHRIIRLVSKAGGRVLTLHIGLGHDSTEPLSWETTVENLRRLVQYGANYSVKVCLENLAWGWTSRPNLFEKLIRRSGAGVTLDIGHAFSCESVLSQQYGIEDFITPHADRIVNAHVYHREYPEGGHIPPASPADIGERLSLLLDIGCDWWVIEIREIRALLKTKKVIEAYLSRRNPETLPKC